MVSKLLAFAAAALLPACQSDGEVRLDLRFPDAPALAPVSADIGQVTLVTYAPDEPPRAETRQVLDPGEPLDMGRISVGEGVTLAVQLRAPNQRLLGYGRSPAALEITADDVVTVPVRVRKPYAYLTGHTRLATFDTTQDGAYRGYLQLSRAPAVTAPTHDGANVVVLSAAGAGAEMTLVSTSTHQENIPAPVPVSAPATGVAVTPDSSWVVVGHAGAGGGVSVIDLVAATQGSAVVEMIPVGNVGEVAIGDRSVLPRAVALVDRAGSTCTGNSSLAVVDLPEQRVVTTIPLGGPVRDLALSGDGRTAVVAACSGQLRAISIDQEVGDVMLTQLTGASAVAVFDDRVWGVGSLPPSGGQTRRHLLVSIGLDGTGETRLELPPPQERAQTTDFSGEGQSAEQRMDADSLDAYDLAVVPGADQVAILTTAYYHAVEVVDLFFGIIIPEMWITAYEYLLVDAASNAVVQRVRTACELDWESDPGNEPLLDDWVCTQAAGQEVSEEIYHPAQVSILYGTR